MGSTSGDVPRGVANINAVTITNMASTEAMATPGTMRTYCSARATSPAARGDVRVNRGPMAINQPTPDIPSPKPVSTRPFSGFCPVAAKAAACATPGRAKTIPIHQNQKTRARRCAYPNAYGLESAVLGVAKSFMTPQPTAGGPSGRAAPRLAGRGHEVAHFRPTGQTQVAESQPQAPLYWQSWE